METLSPRGRLRGAVAVFALRKVPFWTATRKRRVARRCALGLYLYVGLAAGLLALEDRLAFPGWTFSRHWHEPDRALNVRAFDLTTADGNTVRATWMVPPGWTPDRGAVFFAHGNGRNLSHSVGIMRHWRDGLDTAVLGFDYPGFGPSTGRPNEQTCYAAARAAFDWLTEDQGVAAGDVILVGQSMGGGMATEMAARHDCRLLVLVGTYTSFPDMAQKRFPWLPARWLVRSRFDNLGKIRSVRTPVLVAHGTADGVVPFRHGERLYAAAPGPKRFYPMPNHPHTHPRRPEFYAAVRDFLDETRPH